MNLCKSQCLANKYRDETSGVQVGFEALIAEPIPAIELATEPDEAAGVAALHNFINTLEGGPTKYDADVNKEPSCVC